MELNVSITRADFKWDSKWFVQVELDQVSYSSETNQKQKQRTETLEGHTPEFQRTFFIFKISLANKITLRFGAVGDSKCQGISSLVITKRKLSNLRDQVPLKQNLVLKHLTSKEDVCNLSATISINTYGVEEKIIENERTLQKVEFDRYEQDRQVINQKLVGVTELNEAKTNELNQWFERVDKTKNSLRSLGVDLAMLKKQKEQLEEENLNLRNQVQRKQSIESIPAKVDMLGTSPQGAQILKIEYEKLNLRLKVEKMIYQELTEDWLKIEGKQRKFKALKEELHQLKTAQEQLQFHMQTLRDQIPTVLQLRDTIKSHNHLITQFESQLAKTQNNTKDPSAAAEISVLKHQQAIYKQKQQQLELLLQQNGGFLPLEEIQKLQIEEKKPQENHQRIQELMVEIEQLGQALAQQDSRQNPSSDLVQLEVELQAANARVEAIQSQMDSQATLYAQEISNLSSQVYELDAKLESYYK